MASANESPPTKFKATAHALADQYMAQNPAPTSDSELLDFLANLGVAKDSPIVAEASKRVNAVIAAKSDLEREGVKPGSVAYKMGLNEALGEPLAASAPTPPALASELSRSGVGTNAGAAPKSPSTPTGSAEPTPEPKKTAVTAQALNSFDVKYNGQTTLATVDIATAYAKMFQNHTGGAYPQLLGIKVSSSVPVGTPDLRDYLSSELVSREGGLMNVYFTLRWVKYSEYFGADQVWGDRQFAVGRNYFAIHYGEDPKGKKGQEELGRLNNEMLFYVSHALGAKAIKTSVESSSATSATVAAAPVGTAYLGFGMDGPIFNAAGSANASGSDPGSGGIGLEMFVAGNVANKHTLNTIFKTDRAKTTFVTWGVTGKIYFPGNFEISASYGAALGNASRSFVKDVTTFSIGYNKDGGKGQ